MPCHRLSTPRFGRLRFLQTRNMQQDFCYGPKSLRQQTFTGFPFATKAWAIALQRNPSCHCSFGPRCKTCCIFRVRPVFVRDGSIGMAAPERR